MPTLTGFTRPADPINPVELAAKILTDATLVVTVEVVDASNVSVTGTSISESNRTAIQSSITGYVYTPPASDLYVPLVGGLAQSSKLGSGTANSSTFLRGDGTWAAASGGVSDGDKGDITVSSSGTVWSIDAGVVGVTELSATGTANSTTFLRGDNTWAAPSGGSGTTYGEVLALAAGLAMY